LNNESGDEDDYTNPIEKSDALIGGPEVVDTTDGEAVETTRSK